MKLLSLFFTFLLCSLGCSKSQEPKQPFVSFKYDGVLWHSDYSYDVFAGESPYVVYSNLPDGLMFSFYGSNELNNSQINLRFRVQDIGGPVDSLLGISFKPNNPNISGGYGGSQSCNADLHFEVDKSKFYGNFSGKVFLPANAMGGPDTIEITDGKFSSWR